MKKFDHWFFPDHEQHLIENMLKVNRRVDGRLAYQYVKFEAAFKLCRQFRTCVDIGAHVGLFSFWAAKMFTRVDAFEPVDAHRECFRANVKAGNVDLHAYALGALPGKVSIATTKGSSGDSKVAPGDDVEMRTLDSFQFTDVDLLKIDVEGFEENVIVGGYETISRWKPLVIVEQKRLMATRFNLQPLGAVKVLQGMGYKVLQELSGDYILSAQ